MTIFFTSDQHIGHSFIAGNRGFWTEDADDERIPHIQAHDNDIATKWDAQVQPADTVYVLGDTSMSWSQYVADWWAARPGHKHLISGNHDRTHPLHSGYKKALKEWESHFDSIQSQGSIKVAGQKIILSHFPYWSYGDGFEWTGEPRTTARFQEWRVSEVPDQLLIHGHTHGHERGHDTQFHVGWDAWRDLVHEREILKWVEGQK